MEKKTIGRFIAALRRAHGMTQKELGESLFVSDKTVSRWECDECTPELSLIPAIAEIFGVTADELLRGERNSPALESNTEAADRRRVKSDKQFRLLLDKQWRRHSSLTLISLGITILGIIAALIIDLGFSRGLIAFCVATALFTASELCQICFTISARILPDEDDDSHTEQIAEFNGRTVQRTVTVSFVNASAFAFMLPLVLLIDGRNYGLMFSSLMLYGLIFALVALVLLYIVYVLAVRRTLERRALIVLTDSQRKTAGHDRALLLRMIAISAAIALVIGIGIFVLNCLGYDRFATQLTFSSPEEFKTYVEHDYDAWLESVLQDDYRETYYYDSNGNAVAILPSPSHTPDDESENYPQRETAQIVGDNGTVLCEYYYNPELYYRISFTEDAVDKMPVTVITREAYYNSCNIHNAIATLLYAAIVLELAVAAVIYIIGTVSYRRSREKR